MRVPVCILLIAAGTVAGFYTPASFDTNPAEQLFTIRRGASVRAIAADLKADVVVANILAGPLKELYPIISQLVKEGGDLGLSGILETQAQSVCDAYAQSFDLDPVAVKEEWCRITGKLKSA